MIKHVTTLVAMMFSCWISNAYARVTGINIDLKQDIRGDESFESAGPYEKITGRIYFEFDPANPRNARITDLDKAPVNASHRVEAWANFMVLRPKAPCNNTCVGLLEVSNRGRKAALAYFNGARFHVDPKLQTDFGDGFLMRKGLTLIWVGWQFDVPEDAGLLRLHVPTATAGGNSIKGLVRSDWTVDRPVFTLPLSHRGHIAYPVADPEAPQNILTVRAGRLATRKTVPRRRWSFAIDHKGRIIPDSRHIHMASGFKAGQIYELVYVAQDPPVMGLGLAAIRDMMSFAKYDQNSPFHVDQGIAFGVSQTGRFLRHFLYQGFNTDEAGRKVFDGMLIHTAGAGRGSFNHRFAQPSRDAHRYSAFFYPTDIFPFTSITQRDPESGLTDGLFAHQHNSAHLPKIFYTNTGYEYWGRAASLIHTSIDTRRDVEPMSNERNYHLASAQHFIGQFPPQERVNTGGIALYRGNPLDFLVNLRALLVRLVDWIAHNRSPPESRYPRIDTNTLVPIEQVRFPSLPGIAFPRVIHEAYRVDYGPGWPRGIIELQPPRLGKPFPTLVCAVDQFGNEIAGVRNVALRVPVATYTPWNLRTGYSAANDELTDFLGSFIPLPRDEQKRIGTRDPRPSLEKLYPSPSRYLAQVTIAAEELIAEGLLLPEDIDRVTQRARMIYRLVQQP